MIYGPIRNRDNETIFPYNGPLPHSYSYPISTLAISLGRSGWSVKLTIFILLYEGGRALSRIFLYASSWTQWADFPLL
jgi:hypothetical protein